MSQVFHAAEQVKDVQVNMQASIDALRDQYFKLMNTGNKHDFLSENKYIWYNLLELQELLVKGGYLDPEELTDIQPYDVRMDRAAQIFYDYAQNYAPELMSQQYDAFHQASKSAKEAGSIARETVGLNESHDQISLSSLSQCLIGLQKQALSYRKDAKQRDYLHKEYEERQTQHEIKDPKHELFQYAHLKEF